MEPQRFLSCREAHDGRPAGDPINLFQTNVVLEAAINGVPTKAVYFSAAVHDVAVTMRMMPTVEDLGAR
jgi:hypothetical protein